MPQGLKNSHASFSRGMTMVLEGLIDTACVVYLDDILFFGNNQIDHDKNLELVKNRILSYGLEINTEKSLYNQRSVEFLMFTISENTIQPKISLAQGILDFPTPSTKKELHSFLGLINFDSEFVTGLADFSKPLYNILHDQNRQLVWSQEAQKSFEKIKNFWSEKRMLHIPVLK